MLNKTDVLPETIDIDSDAAPTIERDRLYRLWERDTWSALALDFTRDTVEWREQLTEQHKRAIRWSYALFLDGEESVTVTLAPFMQAVTRYEDRIFLATQIADEARHHVFFDRWLREVAGIGADLASTLRDTRPDLTWGYRQVFAELDRAADRLRQHPGDRALLAQGIVLYHLVVEGMLAHTGQHFFREFGKNQGLFPGFQEGIAHVQRDESRHIAFGIQLLRELVTRDRRCKAAAIRMLNRVLPWATGVLTPPNCDWSYISSFGNDHLDVFTFGIRSIETKLRRAGIEPSEVLALVKLGCADTPEEQARRSVTLVEARVIGTDADPIVGEPALDVIFAGVRNIAAWTQPRHRSLRATIQWELEGASPRYLALVPGQPPTVAVGRLDTPTVTLRCTAADWLRISGGRLSQTSALLTRRLRVSGDWSLALRLGDILPV
ncbi:MAG: ribonucleotide-diphosphate reductase subunit beta [Burkholderiales bacterium]